MRRSLSVATTTLTYKASESVRLSGCKYYLLSRAAERFFVSLKNVAILNATLGRISVFFALAGNFSEVHN